MQKVLLSDLISSLKDYFIIKKYWDRQDLSPGAFDWKCTYCNRSGSGEELENETRYYSDHTSDCFVTLAELWLIQNKN